jgi:transposase
MGEAISYALGQWDPLTLFLTDPHVPIDNNASERALRLAALGRKNFLFVGTDEAGENLAGLYSLIATCEVNGVNPVTYLADVLLRVQAHPAAQIDELLPHNWTPPRFQPSA